MHVRRHYKVECAATARILQLQLQQMLRCDVFLDSSHLADLDQLFSKGVLESEVVVLLLTPKYLTRPWCARPTSAYHTGTTLARPRGCLINDPSQVLAGGV